MQRSKHLNSDAAQSGVMSGTAGAYLNCSFAYIVLLSNIFFMFYLKKNPYREPTSLGEPSLCPGSRGRHRRLPKP